MCIATDGAMRGDGGQNVTATPVQKNGNKPKKGDSAKITFVHFFVKN
jgi:hypothetical protein